MWSFLLVGIRLDCFKTGLILPNGVYFIKTQNTCYLSLIQETNHLPVPQKFEGGGELVKFVNDNGLCEEKVTLEDIMIYSDYKYFKNAVA
jgi:hypothetical protein